MYFLPPPTAPLCSAYNGDAHVADMQQRTLGTAPSSVLALSLSIVAVHALQCTRTCFNFVAPHGAWWLARPPSPNGSAWGGAKPSAGWRSPRGHTDCVARRVFEVVLFFFRKT